MAKTSAVTDGNITLGVAVGSRQFVTDQLLSRADVIRAMRERVQLAKIRRQSSPSFGRVWELAVSTTSWRVHGHTILEEHSAAAVFGGIGQRSLSPVRHWVQKSARHRCSCTPESSHRSQTVHPGYDPGRSSGGAFSLSRSRRRVSLRSSRPSPPPISALPTTVSKQRQSCVFRRQLRQQRSLAADCPGTAGTRRHKPDHCIPGTSQLRVPRASQR